MIRRACDAILLDIAIIVAHHLLVIVARLGGHPQAIRALSGNLPAFRRR